MSRRVREHLKTALIAVLMLSLLTLTFAIWLLDSPVTREDTGGLAWLAAALGLVSPQPESISIVVDNTYQEAALPAVFVWTRHGRHWSAPRDAALRDSAYHNMKDTLGAALGSAGQPAAPQAAEAWCVALSADGIYLEFTAPLPLPALSLWLAAEEASLPDVPVRRLALVAQGLVLSLWFIDENDGMPYSCQTAMPAQTIADDPPRGFAPCRFGFETEGYQRAAYSLFFDEEPQPRAAVYTPATLTPPVVAAFLSQLDINPSTYACITQEDGSTTYFSGMRYCQFARRERIRYVAPPDGQERDSDGAPVAAPQRFMEIETARALLAALSPLVGEGRLGFFAVVADVADDVVADVVAEDAETPGAAAMTVTFIYELDGLPVFLSEGPPAVFTFQGGQLIEADIRILAFSVHEEYTPLIPEATAYLLFGGQHPSGDFDLRLVYTEEEGRLTVGWGGM
ncbi:MAG: hypothetical protein FWE59_01175 [Oscillospiraceae bacterium]|nr:hypothetical protein [Oscillospiraceae bacterium]